MSELMLYGPGVLLVYTGFMLGIMSPGPNILAVMGTSMQVGRRQGCALALGVATGSFLWGGLTVSGLSAALAVYADLLIVIKVLGGLFLLWLAYKAFRSAAQRLEIKTQGLQENGLFRFYMRGLLIQMTNPKAAFSWIAIISLGMQPQAPLWVGVAIILGTGGLSIVGHMAYAYAFSTAPMVRLYARARRVIQAGFGLFFTFAGLKLLSSRL
ncbi:LysE family translocator [Aestuariispira insulae]|uniref:Threonine/homoserine/homoserine lactone efflux protein n=1 Tax=Aestuariispira insulae TaxID=1461337 RepID=A0A3D9HIB3_9PROT|nr:LysE family translocator [Aestuariispira insulae]RED49193.1 threonine/homoserine/homoserine lactone efflux protein [Aestuariispira insulae]